MKERRWYSLINIPVQMGLLLLFLGGLLSVIIILGGFTWYCLFVLDQMIRSLITDPAVIEQMKSMVWERGYMAIGTLLIVVTLFCMIVLRMTNRVAGPIYRITEELRDIARTGEFHEIQVRENDYYQRYLRSLNQVLRMVRESSRPPDE